MFSCFESEKAKVLPEQNKQYMKKMADNGFEDWLCKKLTSLDIDNEVYGSYITGILQETDKSERKEALQEVLNSFIVSKPIVVVGPIVVI